MRRRNTILAAVELVRRARGRPNLTQLTAFLYICENEGLNIVQLAELLGATSATASRTATSLEAPPPAGPGWVVSRAGDATGHSRILFLSPEGSALRERMQRLIDAAQAIVSPRLDEVANV